MAEAKRLLVQLALRAQNSSELMANVLARYQELEQLTDDALAKRLQTDAPGLVRLALCKRPAPDARFSEQTGQIAAYANADAAQVEKAIRHVRDIEAIAQESFKQAGEDDAAVSALASGVVRLRNGQVMNIDDLARLFDGCRTACY